MDTDKIFLIKFNSNGVQENFVEKSDADIAIMKENGIIVDDTWLEAPQGFIPDQSVCKLVNGAVSLVDDVVEDFMILFNEFGVLSMWFVKGSEPNDRDMLDSSYENKYFIAPDYFSPKDDKLCFLDIFTKTIKPSTKKHLEALNAYILTGKQGDELESLDYAMQLRKHVLLESKIIDLRSRFQNTIYAKYSHERQRNVDREALPLKSLQSLDPSRLTTAEAEKILEHEEMNAWINEQRKQYKDLKASLQNMSIQELLELD